MAGGAGHVIGAEIVPEAIEDARENARRNGIENVEFFCGDAAQLAADFAGRGLRRTSSASIRRARVSRPRSLPPPRRWPRSASSMSPVTQEPSAAT